MSDELKTLREAAQSGNCNKCKRAIFDLFQQMEPREVLLIIISQLKAYLPVFQGFYPEVLWPNEWLQQIESLRPLTGPQKHDYDLYNEPRVLEEHNISKPGSTSFLVSIERFNSAVNVSVTGNQDSFLELAISAFWIIFGARTDVHWAHTDSSSYITRERLIIRLRHKDSSVSQDELDASEAATMKYWDSSERKEFDRQLLLAIADQIEEVINQQNGPDDT